MRMMKRIAAVAVALVATSLAVTGCSSGTSIEASRATLYSDVASIAADSSAAVEVEVQSQEVVQEDIPYTLSTVTVVTPFQPKGLASALSSKSDLASADMLVIRQLGSTEEQSVPAPILEVGQRYLLFLTPSMMKGEAAAQFYVTGGSAGIYRSENGSFTHVKSEDADTLPATLTTAELTE